MLIHRTLGYVAICQLMFAGTAWASSAATATGEFNDAIRNITQQVNQHPLQPLQLDFAEFLQTLAPERQHSQQVLEQLAAKVQALSPVDTCQQIAKQSLSFHLQLMIERRLLTSSGKSHYPGAFNQMPNGSQWYQHWLSSWLQHNVSLTELQKIANDELQKVDALRQQLKQRKSIKATNRTFLRHQHSAIVAAFQWREHIVNQHLPHLFSFDTAVQPVNVVASTLPKDFPAPGIYDPENSAFIYHLQTDELPEAHMDWLFLHEGVPGHHFQHVLAEKHALCPSVDGFLMPMIMREGWAAYVETLGAEVGLLQDQASYAYVLDWRTLRALRVLIDVGIHAQDWTDERAVALWQRYLPDTPELMQREIARVKRWPAQAITYVYGKYLIEQALLKYATAQNEKNVRSVIFQLTNHIPLALDYVAEFINADADTMETAL